MGLKMKDLEAAGFKVTGSRLVKVASPSPTAPAPATAKPAELGPKLNGWEKKYNDYLRQQMQLGLIKAFYPQAINLRLGEEKCWYKPDFMVVLNDGRIRFDEIKGERRQAGLTKFKVARGLFGLLGSWRMLSRQDGAWVVIMGDKE